MENSSKKNNRDISVSKTFKICVVVLIVFFSVKSCIEPSTPEIKKDIPAEEMLAILDSGMPVNKDDIKVVRIRFLLSELSEKWKESKYNIADCTSRVQGVLKERGINESCLSLLEEMNQEVQANPFIVQNSKYKDCISLYGYLLSKTYRSN